MHRRTAVLAAAVLGSLIAAPAALAGTVQITGDGTVAFTAAQGEANDLAVTAQGTSDLRDWQLADAGAPLTAGPGCVQVDAGHATCRQQGGGGLSIRTGDAADRIAVEDSSSFAAAVTIRAGGGADVVSDGSGTGNPAELFGGPGDDRLSTAMNFGSDRVVQHGGTGNDTLTFNEAGAGEGYGDDGNDRLTFNGTPLRATPRLDGGDGNDTYTVTPFLWPASGPAWIVPGAGFDTLDESGAPFGVQVDLGASCPACVERVTGTSRDDTITGDNLPQIIAGGAGDDVLDGAGGSDLILGQDGNDQINARDGEIDIVSCGAGVDTVTADRRDIVRSDCETVTRGRA